MSLFQERFKRLPRLLDVKNLTQLAKDLDFNPATFSSISTGKNKPGFEIFKSLADQYKQLNIRWLLTGVGDPLLPEQFISDTKDLDLTISKLQTEFLQLSKRLDEIESKKE